MPIVLPTCGWGTVSPTVTRRVFSGAGANEVGLGMHDACSKFPSLDSFLHTALHMTHRSGGQVAGVTRGGSDRRNAAPHQMRPRAVCAARPNCHSAKQTRKLLCEMVHLTRRVWVTTRTEAAYGREGTGASKGGDGAEKMSHGSTGQRVLSLLTLPLFPLPPLPYPLAGNVGWDWYAKEFTQWLPWRTVGGRGGAGTWRGAWHRGLV